MLIAKYVWEIRCATRVNVLTLCDELWCIDFATLRSCAKTTDSSQNVITYESLRLFIYPTEV